MDKLQEQQINNYHMTTIIEEFMKDLRSTHLTKQQTNLLNQFESDIFPYLSRTSPFYHKSYKSFIPSEVWRMI